MFDYSSILFLLVLLILFLTSRRLTSSANSKTYEHAIIIGGSVSGIVTAAYLKKHFRRLTIIESDDVLNEVLMTSSTDELLNYRLSLTSPSTIGRSNVNHCYQIHILQGEGRNILSKLFPTLEKKLVEQCGAWVCSLRNRFRFVIGNVSLHREKIDDFEWFCLDRFTLETMLRREFIEQTEHDQIKWLTNATVQRLIVDRTTNQVLGVEYRDKMSIDSLKSVRADFVVDCSGKWSKSNQWLKDQLNIDLEEEQLDTGLQYLSFVVERQRTGRECIDSFVVGGLSAHAPLHNVGFLTMPIRRVESKENSFDFLSNISIHCFNRIVPPTDSYESLIEWVEEHLPINYSILLRSSQLLSPMIVYRDNNDRRRYPERLKKAWPKGFILLGDSMCSFNPKNGQGMTYACRLARVLDQIFNENHPIDRLSWIYNRRSSSLTNQCWLISTTNDWRVDRLKLTRTDGKGVKHVYRSPAEIHREMSRFTRFLQFYTEWLIVCASNCSTLTNHFLDVVFQYRSPESLIRVEYLFDIVSRLVGRRTSIDS